MKFNIKLFLIPLFSIILISLSIFTCNALTNQEVTNQMNSLKSTYIQERYWNHVGSTNNKYSVTTTPCTHHVPKMANCSLYGYCECNSYNNSIQCHGFAKHIANLVFGTYPAVTMKQEIYNSNGWKLYLNGSSEYSSLKLEPGDFVRCDDHSALIWKIENGLVYVAQVYGGVNCQIDWTHFTCSCNYETTKKFSTFDTESELKSHAKYIVKAPKTTAYTVTLNPNMGTLPIIDYSVVPDSPFSLKQRSYSGLKFMGWSKTINAAEQDYEPTEQITVNSDMTLYGVWAHTITYYDTTGSKKIGTQDIVKGRSSRLTSYTINNFNIVGWSENKNSQNSTYSVNYIANPSSHMTLYAVQKYTVTYNGNGGVPYVSSEQKFYGEAVDYLTYATRENYKFTGWYTQPEGGNKVFPGSISPTYGHVNLYAQWREGNIVYFDLDGGEGNFNKFRLIKKDEPYGNLPFPTKENYIFDGWWLNNPLTGESIRIRENTLLTFDYDQTLVAHWRQGIRAMFVTFDPECDVQPKTVITDEAYGELPVPTREGYIFDGWYLDDECIEYPVTENSIVTATHDFALYAKWIEA